MKVIIAGGRDIYDSKCLNEAIKKSEFEITEVVCGEATGVDFMGKTWAIDNNIIVKPFPAKWNDLSHPNARIKTNSRGYKYDAMGGFRRNEEMAQYADALILVYDGKSPGSSDMLERAEKHNLKIYKYIVNENE